MVSGRKGNAGNGIASLVWKGVSMMAQAVNNLATGEPLLPHERLVDNFGRRITYLRLSVTDRCNLRCRYCMPRAGIAFLPHEEILTFEEMTRVVRILGGMGITKIRLTGGEPFVRNGLMEFIRQLRAEPSVKALHLTTNGVATAKYLPALRALGIAGINLSLDSLRPERFRRITGRRSFEAVHQTLTAALGHGIPLKLNTVIQDGMNDDEIIPISKLAADHAIQVRFIEQMPFGGKRMRGSAWTAKRIIATLQEAYPGMVQKENHTSTALTYQIPGFCGSVGIIGGYSRLFCGGCGKIRITPQGLLKTCLYDKGVLDLKQILRRGGSDAELREAVRFCVSNRAKNGFEAELRNNRKEVLSMASIGG